MSGQNVNVCDIGEDVKNVLKKFRFQKHNSNSALILKVRFKLVNRKRALLNCSGVFININYFVVSYIIFSCPVPYIVNFVTITSNNCSIIQCFCDRKYRTLNESQSILVTDRNL